MTAQPLLDVEDLTVEFATRRFAPTSPASGRGDVSLRPDRLTQI